MLGVTTLYGFPVAAYSASKAGVIGLTRDLAQQWTGRKGIRVNAIAPGFFESEMSGRYRPGYLEAMAARILAGKRGDLRHLAATLVWLASDAASYVTGQTIVVDGGVTLTLSDCGPAGPVPVVHRQAFMRDMAYRYARRSGAA